MASAATRISTQIHVAANILSFRATESTRRAANRVSTMLITQTPSVTDDLHTLPPDPDNSVLTRGLTIAPRGAVTRLTVPIWRAGVYPTKRIERAAPRLVLRLT